MVLELWVPFTQRFRARNWNWAAAGASFTASSVAKRVGVSTPLRAGRGVVVVLVMAVLLGVGFGIRRGLTRLAWSARSVAAGRTRGECLRLPLDGAVSRFWSSTNSSTGGWFASAHVISKSSATSRSRPAW